MLFRRAVVFSVIYLLGSNGTIAEAKFPDLAEVVELIDSADRGVEAVNEQLSTMFVKFAPIEIGNPGKLVPVREGAVWNDATWVAANWESAGDAVAVACSRSSAQSIAAARKFYELESGRPTDSDLSAADRMTWNQLMEVRLRSLSSGGVELPRDLFVLTVCSIRLSSPDGIAFDAEKFLQDMQELFVRVDVPDLSITKKWKPNVATVIVGRNAQLEQGSEIPNMFLNVVSGVEQGTQIKEVSLVLFSWRIVPES